MRITAVKPQITSLHSVIHLKEALARNLKAEFLVSILPPKIKAFKKFWSPKTALTKKSKKHG